MHGPPTVETDKVNMQVSWERADLPSFAVNDRHGFSAELGGSSSGDGRVDWAEHARLEGMDIRHSTLIGGARLGTSLNQRDCDTLRHGAKDGSNVALYTHDELNGNLLGHGAWTASSGDCSWAEHQGLSSPSLGFEQGGVLVQAPCPPHLGMAGLCGPSHGWTTSNQALLGTNPCDCGVGWLNNAVSVGVRNVPGQVMMGMDGSGALGIDCAAYGRLDGLGDHDQVERCTMPDGSLANVGGTAPRCDQTGVSNY